MRVLAYNQKYIMPPCIFIPRILEFNLDTPLEEQNAALDNYEKFTKSPFPQ
jgi:hypothetical protein